MKGKVVLYRKVLFFVIYKGFIEKNDLLKSDSKEKVFICIVRLWEVYDAKIYVL